jgi:hypothetical protein
MNTKLKPYIVFDRHLGSEEGACLVFHFTAKKARYLGWKTVTRHWWQHSYIDVGSYALKDSLHLYDVGDLQKLKANEPHVIECPSTCRECELWGRPLNSRGYCEVCDENDD